MGDTKTFPLQVALGFFDGFTKPFRATVGGASGELKEIGRLANKMSLSMSLPLTTLGVLAAHSNAELERTLALAAQYTGATSADIQRQATAIRRLSATYGMAQADIGEAYYALSGRLGQRTDDVLEKVVAYGRVANRPLTEIAHSVVSIEESFGIGKDRVGEMIDKLAGLQIQLGDVNGEATRLLEEIAAPAAKGGGTLDDMIAVLAKLHEIRDDSGGGVSLEKSIRGMRELVRDAARFPTKDFVGHLLTLSKVRQYDGSAASVVAKVLANQTRDALRGEAAAGRELIDVRERAGELLSHEGFAVQQFRQEMVALRDELVKKTIGDQLHNLTVGARDLVGWVRELPAPLRQAIGWLGVAGAAAGPLLKAAIALKLLRAGAGGAAASPAAEGAAAGAATSLLGRLGALLPRVGGAAAFASTLTTTAGADPSFAAQQQHEYYERVRDAARAAERAAGRSFRPGPLDQMLETLRRDGAPIPPEITVRFENAPPGTRVSTKGDARITTDVGLAMPHLNTGLNVFRD